MLVAEQTFMAAKRDTHPSCFHCFSCASCNGLESGSSSSNSTTDS